ncbi:glycoside hydrolase family 2 protein [Olivibacter sitiensis]|uniref:glycoside hydrolase family 2 protein n=1 Tax=Olivibacter sitiensis TaxID=376470 RepID=UPI000420CEE6|nr:glycoside hydrolase family 2 TIM barrel-domain containing protein [Olivibacter sitiensis]
MTSANRYMACCIVIWFMMQHVYAQTKLIQHIKARTHLSLNGRWNYIIDPYEMGFYDYRREPFENSASGTGGFYDNKKAVDNELVEYDFDLSPTLNVPADWNSQSDQLTFYEGTIWYRNKFNASPQAGKKYLLYFGAANYEAHVYLNGKKVGMHKGGFTPFHFDVTDKLQEGENFVVVKVDNTRKKDEIPTINTDWWNYGGLTRDVLLAELPSSYIQDYKIQLAKDDPQWIEGYVQMSDSTSNQSIEINITDAGIKTSLKTDAHGRVNFRWPAKKLTLWSPENPHLYDVTLIAHGEELQDRIGFRTIAVQGHDILLNGKSIFFRGISIHDENPLIPGRLRGEGDMRMMLQWAKELGCNYVRLAHYPHNESMLRLADEMGLLVWAEVPVYWTISWTNPQTFQNASQQLGDLITRDKNRASVAVWSIGNETPLSDERLDFMTKLAKQVRQQDSTRLVAAALEVHREGKTVIVNDVLANALDLASFNEYGGWYWGGDPSELASYSFDIAFDKPVVITEFGGDALGGFHADEHTRWSEEYQEALYKHQLAMLQKIDKLRGMTPWILTDFRSPRRQHPHFQDFWNRKGLLSETGKKKKAFYVLQDFYRQVKTKYE